VQVKEKIERKHLLRRVEDFLELPMIILGFVWLLLLIIELVYRTPAAIEKLSLVIWGIFIVDFIIKLVIAPDKLYFLKTNVLTIISLVVPALRVFRLVRLLRLLRASRSLRLVKVLGSLNRGMRALSGTMKRRAVGYVLILSLIVLFVGAAGMYAFERDVEGGLKTYGSAVWWTSMILTTMGSDYWPKTTEGRILCFVLAVYAFAVFGYVTATIATFFIGQDAANTKTDLAGAKELRKLRKEILELKALLRNSEHLR
jgi:voltage-gated potassium channel